MENQFTPGPWNGHSASSGQGLVISETTGANVAVAYDQKDTNLLAAAPDMLAALQAIVNCPDYRKIQTLVRRQAWAAIQKAMGG